jgi:benzoyl-CoA reductase/2-hydroxyglutaryl-CoA dehydratase subunit BcrC/BadD/HgdB
LAEIDSLTWRRGVVTGHENHKFLVSASEVCGDVELFERRIDEFLEQARKREPFSGDIRLGYIGVPPIWDDLYQFLESQGARVVFNEIQRQFSMPFDCQDIVDRYVTYTYPYGVFMRLEDISSAISERALDGMVHYTQSFCFRQIEDIIFRKKLSVPILTVEGDQPAALDGRTKLRIGAFIEMLRKNRNSCPRDVGVEGKWSAISAGKDSQPC